MKRTSKEKGLMSIEGSLCLSIFIVMVLFMYSFFVVFEARNVMSHALLAATDSLALDVYQTEKTKGGEDLGAVFSSLYDMVFSKDNPFHSTSRWYTYTGIDPKWNGNVYYSNSGIEENDKNFEDELGNKAYVSDEFGNVIKERFFAYLSGSDNREEIEKILKRYHVVGGMDGIDFSGSRIVDGDLYIVISYDVEYEFNFFNLLKWSMKQSACSRIWK